MTGLLCALPLIAGLFASCAPAPLATGYVEGEYVLVAPAAAARVEALAVRRGDRVAAGARLVVQERRDAEIALAEAEAALAQAESERANLLEGKRAEEIEVIAAALASARAEAEEYAKELARLRALHDRGVVPDAQLETAQTRVDVARAQVTEVEANLEVARLPARPHEIAAAEASVARARAGRDSAAWALDERTLTAPADGMIFEILRRAGEIAGPQAPVLSLLPDGAVLLRLYLPEPALSSIGPGTELQVRCDGCAPDTRAIVTYVSDSPEFTPPVIYSIENRQKLVYLVEARPDASATALKPGQIVDVVFAEGAAGDPP
jgi:HlyD family secretion protein